jgi:hypothetical protein
MKKHYISLAVQILLICITPVLVTSLTVSIIFPDHEIKKKMFMELSNTVPDILDEKITEDGSTAGVESIESSINHFKAR